MAASNWTGTIHVNFADIGDLMLIPGINNKSASAIVKFRELRGNLTLEFLELVLRKKFSDTMRDMLDFDINASLPLVSAEGVATNGVEELTDMLQRTNIRNVGCPLDTNEGGEGNNWNGTGHDYENTKLEVQATLDQCKQLVELGRSRLANQGVSPSAMQCPTTPVQRGKSKIYQGATIAVNTGNKGILFPHLGQGAIPKSCMGQWVGGV